MKAVLCMVWPPCLELAINGQLESLAHLHLQRRRQGLKIQEPQWRPLSLVAFPQRYDFLAPSEPFGFLKSENRTIFLPSLWAQWSGWCALCLDLFVCAGGDGHPGLTGQEPETSRDAGPATSHWRRVAWAHWKAGASAGHWWCVSANYQPILESG